MRFNQRQNEDMQEEDEMDQYAAVNDYSEAQGKISEWIQKENVTKFIKR